MNEIGYAIKLWMCEKFKFISNEVNVKGNYNGISLYIYRVGKIKKVIDIKYGGGGGGLKERGFMFIVGGWVNWYSRFEKSFVIVSKVAFLEMDFVERELGLFRE